MDIIDLLNKLDYLTAWRKRELSQAQFLAENAKNKDSRRYLCRAWVLMIYAHCDNFLKESTRAYLEYLKFNLKSMTDYKYDLMWLVIRAKDNIIKASDAKYVSLNDYYSKDCELYFDEVLITETLKKESFKYRWLRYFCDWVLQINFDHGEFSDFCERIKEKRDSIAHGEESYIDSTADCLVWHKKAIEFMDSLKDSLIENVRIKSINKIL